MLLIVSSAKERVNHQGIASVTRSSIERSRLAESPRMRAVGILHIQLVSLHFLNILECLLFAPRCGGAKNIRMALRAF
jgi:hypothetical protein